MKIAARHLKTHGILPVGFYCRYFPVCFRGSVSAFFLIARPQDRQLRGLQKTK